MLLVIATSRWVVGMSLGPMGYFGLDLADGACLKLVITIGTAPRAPRSGPDLLT